MVDDLCCTLPTNQTICNQHGGSDWIIEKGYLQGDFLAINRDNGTLTWYSPYGIKINRTYSFPRTPLHAIFCLFDTHDVGAVASSQTSETAAVAILVNEFELQIHYESGEKFEILLPVAVNNIFSTPVGILLQVSRSHYAKMISGLTAAHSVPSLALSSHHLLIRTPRSPIEFIPR